MSNFPSPDVTRCEVDDWRERHGLAPDPTETHCPNCHHPHSGLVGTPPMGPDGAGVMHCGCFYEGSAKGKEYHVSTTSPEALRYMGGEEVTC